MTNSTFRTMPPLFAVLWRPRDSFQRLGSLDMGTLLAWFIGIEFVLTLAILPYLIDMGVKAMARNPALTDSVRLFATGFAVVTVSLFDTLLIGAVALLLLLLVRILGGNAQYRDLAGMLVLASMPLLLGRALRNLAYLLGYAAEPTSRLLSLAQLVPDALVHASHGTLAYIDIFDVWVFALVVSGFILVAGVRRGAAALAAVLVWGMLQLVLLRLQLGGAA